MPPEEIEAPPADNDFPLVRRDPNLRPGQDGWTWPNVVPKAVMVGRNESLAQLFGIKTSPNAVRELEWKPGWGKVITISEHLLR